MEKVIFLDRDGTLINEPPDEQIDNLEKLEFLPGVFRNLYLVKKFLDYKLVIVSNQDGLGTNAYPEEAYQLVQDKIIKTFKNEGIEFDDVLIDKSLPGDNAPTRKPKTGLLTRYLEDGRYDLANSYVIGDRITDIELAKNLGAKGILYGCTGLWNEIDKKDLQEHCKLITSDWNKIFEHLRLEERTAIVSRKTRETEIKVEIDLDGTGNTEINTGLGFFDHMLEQIGKHGGINIKIEVKGDLQVDEHHTVEDTALVLGEAIHKALGNKRGIERYGFVLPMDDSMAQVAIDFSGRSWLVWDARFTREKVGDVPTELFFHFFKSFSDAARCNLNIKAEGQNEHHKIEAIFKGFAKAIKMAAKRDVFSNDLPSTKGVL